jgi:hypothetical protein
MGADGVINVASGVSGMDFQLYFLRCGIVSLYCSIGAKPYCARGHAFARREKFQAATGKLQSRIFIGALQSKR